MLTITVRCDRDSCQGTVRFAREKLERRPRSRHGICDSCGAEYSLFGGQIQQLQTIVASSDAIGDLHDEARRDDVLTRTRGG
jgi:hypothetical protein